MHPAMHSFVNHNKTASRIVRIFWNDGLLDLMAGLGVSLMGCAWLCDMVPLGAVAPAIVIPFWTVMRARITQPRLGFVEFSDAQQSRNKVFLITSIALGVVIFVVAVSVYLAVSGARVDAGVGIAALPAIIVALMALMTAAITSLNRFILYAAFLVTGGITVSWLDADPGWSLLAGGLATVLGGGIALSRFISRHPNPPEPHESGATYEQARDLE